MKACSIYGSVKLNIDFFNILLSQALLTFFFSKKIKSSAFMILKFPALAYADFMDLVISNTLFPHFVQGTCSWKCVCTVSSRKADLIVYRKNRDAFLTPPMPPKAPFFFLLLPQKKNVSTNYVDSLHMEHLHRSPLSLNTSVSDSDLSSRLPFFLFPFPPPCWESAFKCQNTRALAQEDQGLSICSRKV